VITYATPKIGEIYISEQPSLIASGGTTGLRTWEASLLLSEWLLEQNIERKSVLELGAGTGLVGILAAKMGAKVMATDGSDMVVTKLSGNFELNNVSIDSGVLWWGDENEILKRKWDLIVGADITYDEDVCSSLAETYALGIKHGATGILAATVRNERTLMVFVKECGMIFWCRTNCRVERITCRGNTRMASLQRNFFLQYSVSNEAPTSRCERIEFMIQMKHINLRRKPPFLTSNTLFSLSPSTTLSYLSYGV
jgi:hypothetical protein